MKKNILLLSLLGFVAVGCTTTRSQQAMAIVEADEQMVTGCQFVGDVTGSSMMSSAAAKKGRENAKTAALEDAAKLGATHVVWSNVSTIFGGGSSANGKAYRCAAR